MQSQNVVLMINKFFPRVILIRIFPFGRPKVFSVLNLIVFSVPLGIFFLSQSIFFLFLFKPRLYIYSIYLFYWYNCKCSCKLCLEGNQAGLGGHRWGIKWLLQGGKWYIVLSYSPIILPTERERERQKRRWFENQFLLHKTDC